jgi:hypothetical protein
MHLLQLFAVQVFNCSVCQSCFFVDMHGVMVQTSPFKYPSVPRVGEVTISLFGSYRRKQLVSRKQRRKKQPMKSSTSGRQHLVWIQKGPLKTMLKKRVRGCSWTLWNT